MRASTWLKRLSVLGGLVLVQCNAPQPVPVHSAFDDAPPALRMVEPQFRDGLGRLTSARSWPIFGGEEHTFDWVLLGVRARWDGEERIWFVRIAETIDPEEAEGGRRLSERRFSYDVPFGVGSIRPDAKFTVRCRRIRIETYDANGEFTAAWSRLMPDVFPGSSLYQSFAALPRCGPLGSDAQAVTTIESHANEASADSMAIAKETCERGLYSLVAKLQALGTTAPLRPIRDAVKEHIIAMPSILSLLLSGLKPTITAAPDVAEAGEFPWVFDRSQLPCLQSTFTVNLAGARFMECRVVAAPSAPPVDLLGGLLVLEAVHPDHPDNRLTVRVLASSRAQLGE